MHLGLWLTKSGFRESGKKSTSSHFLQIGPLCRDSWYLITRGAATISLLGVVWLFSNDKRYRYGATSPTLASNGHEFSCSAIKSRTVLLSRCLRYIDRLDSRWHSIWRFSKIISCLFLYVLYICFVIIIFVIPIFACHKRAIAISFHSEISNIRGWYIIFIWNSYIAMLDSEFYCWLSVFQPSDFHIYVTVYRTERGTCKNELVIGKRKSRNDVTSTPPWPILFATVTRTTTTYTDIFRIWVYSLHWWLCGKNRGVFHLEKYNRGFRANREQLGWLKYVTEKKGSRVKYTPTMYITSFLIQLKLCPYF